MSVLYRARLKNGITISIDRGKPVLLVLLKTSEVFDTVDYKTRLVYQIKYGFNPILNNTANNSSMLILFSQMFSHCYMAYHLFQFLVLWF